MVDAEVLRAPFPYPGGKRRVANLVWRALGDVRVYVEPFFGSGAVLLSRPSEPGIETVNDLDGLLVHFWRALRADPQAVAEHADYPVSEIDLHARHRELVRRAGEVKAQLEADPRWFDAELAGWWVWGLSQWIGGGWCSPVRSEESAHPSISHASHGVHRKRPVIAADNEGRGVHRKVPERRPNLTTAGTGVQRQLPDVHALGGNGVLGHRIQRDGLAPWFEALAERLRRVRIVCGDFERVLTKSTLYTEGSQVAGVFLDPPYAHDRRSTKLYAHDAADVSARAREWALAHGDDARLRIVLAGLEGEHEMPASWRKVEWTGPAGLGRVSGNRHIERLWLSPSCLRVDEGEQLGLFAEAANG